MKYYYTIYSYNCSVSIPFRMYNWAMAHSLMGHLWWCGNDKMACI